MDEQNYLLQRTSLLAIDHKAKSQKLSRKSKVGSHSRNCKGKAAKMRKQTNQRTANQHPSMPTRKEGELKLRQDHQRTAVKVKSVNVELKKDVTFEEYGLGSLMIGGGGG